MSWNLNQLAEVRYVRERIVCLRFDDGLSGEVDLSAYVECGPIFEPLAEENFFKQARIEGGTIAWPNGADIAPERLYELLEKADGRTPACP